MDGRNRTLIRIPDGLRFLVERYQNDRLLTSLNAAIVELLETHPAIAERVRAVYAECHPSTLSERDLTDDGIAPVARVLHGDLYRREVPHPRSHDAFRR